MGIEDTLRQWQDSARDAGWRIKTIPWQQDNRPEYVYNTPLTLATGCGGALVFVGSVALAVSQIMPLWILGVGAGGLVMAILGRVYAAWHKSRRWRQVQAVCLDRELREGKVLNTGSRGTRIGGPGTTTVWGFRVLCEFSYKGQDYTVTPVPTNTVAFGNQTALEKYLDGTIGADRKCRIWMNPENPLQCCFDKRPKI